MSHLSRTLKRLGVAAVGAATLLATPYLAVAPASAGTPTAPTTITILSQLSNGGSTTNDGTNATVRLSADVTVPMATNPAVASVKFSYQISGSPVVVIGSVAAAPYSVEWTPPGDGAYTEFAEAFSASGISINSASRQVNIDSVTPAVHILTPPDGGLLGRSSTGSVLVTGTRSAGLPLLSVTAATRDDSTGIIGASGAATVISAGGTAAWSASVAAPACPNTGSTGCDVFITAVAGSGAAISDEVSRATLYTQQLSSLAVTPTSSSRSTNSPQIFVATPLDQNNQIVPGITVTITKSTGSTAVLTPTSGLSAYPTGQVSFTVSDTSLATTKLTISTGNTASDFARYPSFTTYISAPTAAAFAVTPLKPLYATPYAGTLPNNGNVNSPVSEYTATTPTVDVCFTDVNGIPIDSSVAGTAAKVFATVTRSTKTGTVTSAPVSTNVTATSDQVANPGCFAVPHPAAGSEEEGSVTFTAMMNNDGIPGYQAGGSDVQSVPQTLRWGQLKATGINTQAVQSTRLIVTMAMATPDGTPFAGRTLGSFAPYTTATGSTLSPNATFPILQPSGSTLVNPSSVTCTTNALGQCQVIATDASSDLVFIRLSDVTNDAATNKLGTNGFGQMAVQFRATSVALASVAQGTTALLQPAVNTSSGKLRPGDVQHYTYMLKDSGGGALTGMATTLTVDNGFFTPDCLTYISCSFTSGPAAGAPTGQLVNLGKSFKAFSDINGLVSFSVTIGRDPLLDATGVEPANLTVLCNAGTATAALVPFTTAGITPANGQAMTVLPLTTADKLAGNVADNGSNKIFLQSGMVASPGSNFRVALTDQFGNAMTLGTCAVTLTVTGAGVGYLNTPGTTTVAACGSFAATAAVPVAERFHLDSDDLGTTGAATTMTASWPAPVTTFLGLGTVPQTYTTGAGTPATTALTGTVAVTLYAVDVNKFNTVYSTTPPAGSEPLNTPVTAQASVQDQMGSPRTGMRIGFTRTGPNDAAGNTQSKTAFAYTDQNGLATFAFTSATPGEADVMVTLTNSGGSVLSQGKQVVVFGNVSPTPSPSASPTASATPTPSATPTATPAPTSTPTPVPTGPVTIDGAATQTPAYGSTFVITGTAPANALVTLFFHRGGTAATDYSIVRSVTADGNGAWSRPIAATSDYRYYATAGAAPSGSVLNQPADTVTGASSRQVPLNQLYALTGTALPGSTVYVHFHLAGTPAGDYSIVRAVLADSSGTWTKTYLASADYRLYVSRSASDSASFTSYLVQAR